MVATPDREPLEVLIGYSPDRTHVYIFTEKYAKQVQQVVFEQQLRPDTQMPTDVAHLLQVHATLIDDPEWAQGIQGVPFNPAKQHLVKHLTVDRRRDIMGHEGGAPRTPAPPSDPLKGTYGF